MTSLVCALALSFVLALPFPAAQGSAALTASSRESPPPASLAKPIAQALARQGVRVLVGTASTALDFWWVAALPLKAGADLSKFLVCPMPGLVKAISVTEGQDIKAGDPLAVVEAMKMENVLRAERDATVKKINARPGDSLAVDAVIMEFA